MKKLFLLLVSVFTMQVAMADNDKPVTFEQLPQAAQAFIKQNFADREIAFAKVDKDWFDATYDVLFTNGEKLEFNKKGEWKEIGKAKKNRKKFFLPPPKKQEVHRAKATAHLLSCFFLPSQRVAMPLLTTPHEYHDIIYQRSQRTQSSHYIGISSSTQSRFCLPMIIRISQSGTTQP